MSRRRDTGQVPGSRSNLADVAGGDPAWRPREPEALEIGRLQQTKVVEAIVRERVRIARELHHTLAHSMLAVLAQIRSTRKLCIVDPTAVEPALAETEKYVTRGLAGVREAITAYRRRSSLTEAGLANALERLVSWFRANAALDITLEIDEGVESLGDFTDAMLYLITEETLRNIECHAHAQHARIELKLDRCRPGWLTLTITDDGQGFDVNLQRQDRYGLIGMREQAELTGGCFEIESTIGQGTSVSVSLPITPPNG
jgi:signal transduction histidine kinase